LTIDKTDYSAILDQTAEVKNDWKSLMAEEKPAKKKKK